MGTQYSTPVANWDFPLRGSKWKTTEDLVMGSDYNYRSLHRPPQYETNDEARTIRAGSLVTIVGVVRMFILIGDSDFCNYRHQVVAQVNGELVTMSNFMTCIKDRTSVIEFEHPELFTLVQSGHGKQYEYPGHTMTFLIAIAIILFVMGLLPLVS